MIWNKNFIKYNVLDLTEVYNFDISFIFIRLYLKKIYLCCVYF
jgi:hypothetical protein